MKRHLALLLFVVALLIIASSPPSYGQGWAPSRPGGAGGSGTAGINAFSTTTANFTQPAVGANVTVSVANSQWIVAGQVVYVGTGTSVSYVTPQFVQLADNDPGGGVVTTLSQAYTSNVTRGNRLVVGITYINASGAAPAALTISDTQSNVWASNASRVVPNGGQGGDFTSGAGAYIFSSTAGMTGADTVQINFNTASGVQFPNLRITEYNGLGSFDSSAGNFTTGNGTGPTVASTGNFTTNFPVEMLVCFNLCTGVSASAGSGWTLRNLSAVTQDVFEDQATSSAGTYAGTVNVQSDGTLILAGGFVALTVSGGYYTAISKPTTTSVVLQNLGYVGNASPGSTVTSGAGIAPGGLQGP